MRCAHPFLAPQDPTKAPLLVVEGWLLPKELDEAIARFKSGNYVKVITAGGPVTANLNPQHTVDYADLARDYLIRHGLSGEIVTAAPTPASARNRTFLSAVMVREWLARSGQQVKSLDVLFSGVHSRRSRTVYRLAFGPDVRIGIHVTHPTEYDPAAWWQTSAGVKIVITEAVSWIWTELFFHPGAQGTHEEKWGQAQQPVQNAKG